MFDDESETEVVREAAVSRKGRCSPCTTCGEQRDGSANVLFYEFHLSADAYSVPKNLLKK